MKPNGGSWWVWVTRDGRFVITASDAAQPEPTAWPIAAESSHSAAVTACMAIGELGPGGHRRLPGFAGTIGAALELRQRFAHARAWREEHAQGHHRGVPEAGAP